MTHKQLEKWASNEFEYVAYYSKNNGSYSISISKYYDNVLVHWRSWAVVMYPHNNEIIGVMNYLYEMSYGDLSIKPFIRVAANEIEVTYELLQILKTYKEWRE